MARRASSVRTVPIGRGAYVRGRLALLGAVAATHDCELVWQSGPDGATALLAGFRDDLDATAVLYESLHLQAAARMAAVRRATPAATQRWRRAFLFGFASRVGDLLAEARRHAEDDVGRHGVDAARPAGPRRAGQGLRGALVRAGASPPGCRAPPSPAGGTTGIAPPGTSTSVAGGWPVVAAIGRGSP